MSRDELLAVGFSSVGEGATVSRLARFYAIEGTLGAAVRIDDFAILTGMLTIEDGAHISPFCFIGGTGGRVTMKRNSGIAAGTVVYTKSEDYKKPGLGTKVVGDVTIGEDVAIGSHCTLMPGTSIGDGAKVGAHAVISGEVAAHTLNVSRAVGIIPVGRAG